MAGGPQWRQHIIDALQKRDEKHVHTFKDIFEHYQRLFETMDSVRRHGGGGLFNQSVPHHQQHAGDSVLAPSSQPTSSAVQDRTQTLEQKLFRLQEELTDLHRRRGENAQMIVDLNADLANKRQMISERDQLLAERLLETDSLRHQLSQLEQNNSELTATNQTLKDEFQALHLALVRTETALKEAQNERDLLLARWIDLKSRDVDRMNAENDDFVRRRQQRLQRELEDATREEVMVPQEEPRGAEPVTCGVTSLPTHCINAFDAHESEVNALCWSPSGRYLASGGGDRKVKLWTGVSSQQQCVGQYSGSNKAINSIAFDPYEHLLLAASNDLASRVWGVTDFRLKYTLTGHSGQVMMARFLDGSQRAVTASRDRTLKIWELARGGDCVLTLFASSICFDVVEHTSSLLVSGHYDNTLKLWDRRASFEPKHTVNLDGHVTSVAPASDYRVLCSTRDDVLKMVDMRTLSVCRTFEAEGFHLGCDFSRCSISGDGAYVSAGTASGDVFVWCGDSGALQTKLAHSDSQSVCASASGQMRCVVATAWEPSGKCLVSADRNRKISVWSSI